MRNFPMMIQSVRLSVDWLVGRMVGWSVCLSSFKKGGEFPFHYPIGAPLHIMHLSTTLVILSLTHSKYIRSITISSTYPSSPSPSTRLNHSLLEESCLIYCSSPPLNKRQMFKNYEQLYMFNIFSSMLIYISIHL